jgi:hypothetical protein
VFSRSPDKKRRGQGAAKNAEKMKKQLESNNQKPWVMSHTILIPKSFNFIYKGIIFIEILSIYKKVR